VEEDNGSIAIGDEEEANATGGLSIIELFEKGFN
jgi:hypothetical protein